MQATNTVTTAGGTLNFTPALANNYARRDYTASTNGQSRYQVIRIPQFNLATLSADVTAYKWDGETGGVIAMDVLSTLNFNGNNIDGSASGFRGGGGRSLGGGPGGNTSYVTLSTIDNNGQKAEGIAGTPAYIWNGVPGAVNVINTGSEGYPDGSSSRGAPGNAGGGGQDGSPGGNSENAGGGGGGNGGAGGQGGNTWFSNNPTGGVGGALFNEASVSRIVLGGGGGAGNGNNSATNPDALSGGVGGAIVIIKARTIAGTGTINVNGQTAQNVNSDCCDEGAGAGGAGGSVIFTALITTGMANITVTANGGNGGNTVGDPGIPHGPGGGGGGGIVYSNGSLNGASSVTGGINGTTSGGIAYGSLVGADGVLSQVSTNDPTAAYAGYKCALPLPVSYIRLSAGLKNNFVSLQWKTLAEANTDYFEIERSYDNRSFSKTGSSIPAAGNNNSELTYTAQDDTKTVTSNIIYYRIKVVDKNGKVTYSNTFVIRLAIQNNMTVWPNPFTETIDISIHITESQNILIKIIDVSGKIVRTSREAVYKGYNQVSLSKLNMLSKGVYMLSVQSEQTHETNYFKLVKN